MDATLSCNGFAMWLIVASRLYDALLSALITDLTAAACRYRSATEHL